MKNSYLNYQKMIAAADNNWEVAKKANLADLTVELEEDGKLRHNDHIFFNLCSCSYLGLDTHPKILEAARDAITKTGLMHLTTARVRIRTRQLDKFERQLSHHFDANCMSFNSCASATSATLPLIASGAFSKNKKPTMVFDKLSHFSIKHIVPICADETDIHIAPHSDLNFIEDICKKNERVCFVGDGTYSMGQIAPIEELKMLQDKYGMMLYLDDSHGLSVTGEKGYGVTRSSFGDLDENTFIVASLAKAFGTCGGLLMSGQKNLVQVLERYGNAWSQYLNSAGIGAGQASLEIHGSNELTLLQKKLHENLKHFDKLIPTPHSGNLSPIRLIILNSIDKTVDIAESIFKKGFYTSPVFFPIVQKGTSGLRVMPNARLKRDNITYFAELLKEFGVDTRL